MKRILGMLLCMCMLISSIGITADAATAVNIFNITVELPKAGEKPSENASIP